MKTENYADDPIGWLTNSSDHLIDCLTHRCIDGGGETRSDGLLSDQAFQFNEFEYGIERAEETRRRNVQMLFVEKVAGG